MTQRKTLYATGAATGALYVATAGAVGPESTGDWLLMVAAILQIVAGFFSGPKMRGR